MTKIIGLTGSIGTGKSTVARIMEKSGAFVIDTDKIAHDAYKPGTDTWKAIISAFGQQITRPDGEIDRNVLAKVVFKDPDALAKLNGITHPRILQMTQELIGKYRAENPPVVVLEVPLLIEAGWKDAVDEVWLVTAPKTKVVERLKKQRGLTKTEIGARMRSRLPDNYLKKYADVVIVNDGNRIRLKKKILAEWERLTSQNS